MYTLSFTRLIVLFTVVSQLYFTVKATAVGIPTCAGTGNLCAAASRKRKEKRALVVDNYCISDDNKLYKAITNGCEEQTSLTENTYYVYECSDDSCANVKGIANEKTNILVYQYADSTLKQIKSTKYYDGSNKLYICDADGKCPLAGEGIYLLTSSDENVIANTLVNCDANGNCPIVTTPGYYYIDSKVIKLDDTGANEQTSNDGKNYLDEVTKDTNGYTKIIKCGSSCVLDSTAGIYVNSAVTVLEKAIISCTSDGCEALNGNDGYYYLNYGDDKATKPLINCTSTKCEAIAPPTTAGSYYYLDQGSLDGTIFKKYISCTVVSGSDTTCESKDKAANIFVNSAVTVLEKAIISCTSDGCNAINGKDGDYYLNSGADNETKPLINCDSAKCEAKATSETDGTYYYLDQGSVESVDNQSVIKKYLICTVESKKGTCKPSPGADGITLLNSAVTGKQDDALISCSSTKCESIKGEEGYYLNVDSAEKPNKFLVKCTSEGCTKEESTLAGFYLNVKPDDTKKFKTSLIECTGTTADTCDFKELTDAANKDSIFINNAGKLIQCLEDAKGCNAFAGTGSADKPTFYVNGSPTANVITDALIKCDGTECKTETGTENAVYINGNFKEDSSNPNGVTDKHLIICSKTECNAVKGDEGYYVNGSPTAISDALIKCDGTKCEAAAGTDKAVYINGNFKDATSNPDGVTDKRLITCDTSKCETTETTEIDESITTVSYFVNGANASSSETRKRGSATQASPYKNALIQCPTEKTKPCTLVDGAKNNIYLNGNKSKDTSYLIICGDSCAVAAGKATSEDEYYVNAGASDTDKLKDTLIQCKTDKCETVVAKEGDIYVNTIDKQLIQCSKDDGCVAKSTKANSDGNEFFINSSDDAADITKDIIKCSLSENNDGTKECKIVNGKELAVYVNARNTTEVIYCLSSGNGGCKTKASQATETTPEYYLNGDDIDYKDSVDTKKLKGDLIECKMNKSVIKCSVINGNDGDVYINSNYNKDSTKGDATNQIIQCSKDEGCVGVAVSKAINVEKTELATLPLYFLNSGNKGSNKFQEALIKCAAEGDKCEIVEAAANDVYTNGNANQKDMPLIKCNKSNCAVAGSAATEKSKEYYINAGKADEQALKYDIISCSVTDNAGQKETQCKCLKADEVKSDSAVYLNSNYSEAGDKNQLIQCDNDNGCVGVKTESTQKTNEYYVNAESDTLTNAIIFCSNKNCEKQTPENTPVYFVGKDKSGVDGLIECKEVEEAADADAQAANRKRATATKCVMKSAFTSEGYYLNSGSDKATNQVILCDASEGCSALKVDLGYYVNAGNPAKPIIKCEKEANECTEDASPSCPASNVATPGNYCYENGQLKFFASNNSTAVVATKYEDAYAFATIPAKEFPGIRTETGSLFKISSYFINRYYQSGVVMIDKNGKLVDTLTSDQSDISIYNCNETTKICTEKKKCISNTYMFDSENKRAIFCNDGKMEYAKFNGYVVDGNRSSGSKHPYIIQCENNGLQCTTIRPKINTYYENNGYDSETNALIECINSNCFTTTATIGYYAAHGVNENSGVIKCASSNTCSYSYVKGDVKFVNAGSDKISNALISCAKNKGCSVAKAKIGYYLTHTSTLLIQCTSPSNCAEFTPSVNYYNNADSSESSNTIINCVQNSNVVSCGLESTNNGFYMSSVSNVLIRCKAGKKCKTVTVKNGMFRGALKGLTSSEKRNAEVEDSEVDGTKVAVRGDSDEAYGIIRCSAGKCTALSPSELAAIPICEFNNNKCYITNDYAMTKSATTSITAGNICTNEDRSVFYFATDTVVVKPDVISAITSTYVYTTTTSNCLEVNDSYDDMYFTVGPNIYLLDQGSVLQFYDTGYYFINIEKNTLVKGNKIDAYNNENVKLYKCDGSTCNIMNKPESVTYFADANKRILKYDVQNDVYSFAYDKDITCYFVNNKCTPNADLNAREFCITYKGEIVLATTDIKNRETGECYRASSMNSNIYGISQSLYSMNLYSAQMVDQTGYYIISRSSNSTVVSKNYKGKNSNLVIYGCTLSQCKVVEPDEDVYYYDPEAKTILRYKNGAWNTPSASGFAYISINPTEAHVYKFSKKGEEITVQSKATSGYYYTVDNEMYQCGEDNDGQCKPISDTGYYFTNIGEVYYCIHDSEELEATECTRQACVSGQYYYINDAYYRCEVSSLLTPVVSRYCSYDEHVIINYPTALTEELPANIKQAVEGIEKHNNSTAVIKRTSNKHYLDAVAGVFTNCTYNVEETKSTFDLVCVNNFVTVDKEYDEVKICSVEQLGYVECVEDENNPEKCNVSAAYAMMKPSMLVVFIALILTTLYHLY